MIDIQYEIVSISADGWSTVRYDHPVYGSILKQFVISPFNYIEDVRSNFPTDIYKTRKQLREGASLATVPLKGSFSVDLDDAWYQLTEEIVEKKTIRDRCGCGGDCLCETKDH